MTFLEERLKIAQKNWSKANEKWMAKKTNYTTPGVIRTGSFPIAQRLAFYNGQVKLLKELIALERLSSKQTSEESK